MRLELGKEYAPANESKYLQQIINDSNAIRTLTNTQHLRGQHAKATSGMKATFEVLDSSDSRAKHGLFAKPGVYDAILRFSNGTGRIQPDLVKDGRGLAVKVMGIGAENRSQDFVMINFKAFPIRNARQYANFIRWRYYLAKLPAPVGPRLMPFFFFATPSRIGQFFRVARHVPQKIASVVQEEYHSMSPYRLGAAAIKFSVGPEVLPAKSQVPNDVNANFLSQELTDCLRAHDIVLRMRVQFQEDPKRHPVEDASVIWEGSDVVDVARIVIPKQDLASESAQELARKIEAMSFNPWHTLPEHQPIGGINRLRKAVYEASFALRNAAHSMTQ